MKLRPTFLPLAFIATASLASAQIVTYTIDGTINTVLHSNSPSGLGSVFTPGENFELKFTGDASSSPSFSLPILGLYAFDLTSGQITAGSTTFTFDSSSLGLSQDLGTTFLSFGGFVSSPAFTLTATLGSFDDLYPAGAFPSTLPAFSAFNLSNQFTLEEFSQIRGNLEAFGKITSIDVSTSSPVPEPSSYSLIGAGVLGLGAVLRRRRAV